MMGVEAAETCWATHKRQVINLWNSCIWLVNLFELKCLLIAESWKRNFSSNTLNNRLSQSVVWFHSKNRLCYVNKSCSPLVGTVVLYSSNKCSYFLPDKLIFVFFSHIKQTSYRIISQNKDQVREIKYLFTEPNCTKDCVCLTPGSSHPTAFASSFTNNILHLIYSIYNQYF